MATDDGGRAAFVARLQAHRGIAFKVAHAYARDADDRADLVQEIAVALWQAWPRYDAERPFSTWMYRVALNTALDGVRERARRLRYTVPFDETTPDVPDERVGPEGDPRMERLQRFLRTQRPLERALLLLYLDDRSTREIADVLGLSETNVTTKIARLKQRIRAAG